MNVFGGALSEASSDMADMATCIIVGSVETRLIARSGKEPIVYSPRFSKRES